MLWPEKRQQQESRNKKGASQVEKLKIPEKLDPYHTKWSWEQKEDTWTYLLAAFPHLLLGELREQCWSGSRRGLAMWQWRAVGTGSVSSGGDRNGAGQEKAGGTQGEWLPLHVMARVPCQEAAHLLHTICISEEIFSVKHSINNDPVRLELLALGTSIARQCITPLSHWFHSHVGLYWLQTFTSCWLTVDHVKWVGGSLLFILRRYPHYKNHHC